MRRRKIRCSKGENLKGEKLCLYHEKAREGKLYHWSPVMKCSFCESIPALPPINEVYIEEQEHRKQVISHGNCNWGPNEAPIKVPDKEPIHECIQWCGNQQ